jgi:hypothetical protein
MNQDIMAMAKQCGDWNGQTIEMNDVGLAKFAELIVRECMGNLEWHGHDEAVSQLNWFLGNKIRG